MRVVVFGGYADSLINFRGPMLRAMAAKGHHVTAIAPAASPKVVAALAGMGVAYRDVPLSRTGLNPLADLWTLLQLYRLFRELRPDALLSYTIKPVIYGSLAARFAGVPAIYSMITGLGYAFGAGRRSWVTQLAKNLYRAAIRRNRKVFFQNPDDRDFFAGEGILARDDQPILINGSGVDLQRFVHVPFGGGASPFLLIGRLIRDKGIVEYVEAARLVKSRHPSVEFRLLGPLDSNPSAISAEEVRAWENEGVIAYLGETSDVRPALHECAVYVLPSYAEGTPRTVLEAMATGRAVITTDAPGCRETVIDGMNGFLVPPRDAAALAEAMERMIASPGLVQQMGAAGRRMAEEKYDVVKVNAVILAAMGL